jgi:two-component system response regulator HydG
MMRLTAYGWPGNVRQLLNAVQNAVVTALGDQSGTGPVRVAPEHIPEDVASPDSDAADPGPNAAPGSLAGSSLEQLEKRAIRETLQLTGGNREKAAKLLGIGERTLYRKLKEYGLR